MKILSGGESFVFEDGNCFDVSAALKNKANDSERGDCNQRKTSPRSRYVAVMPINNSQ